jgi:hypothetical protein
MSRLRHAFLLICALLFAAPAAAQSILVPPSAGGGQTTVSSTSDPTVSNDSSQGYATGQMWFNTATGRVWTLRDASVGAAVWTQAAASWIPRYISGRWYHMTPEAGASSTSGGESLSTNYFLPFTVKTRSTWTDIGVWIQTAGGNIKLGIYANNDTTNRPTGNVLCQTNNIDVTGTGVKSGAFTSACTLEPGRIYWFAQQTDNTAVRFSGPSNSDTWWASLLGSATEANIMSSASAFAIEIEVTGVTYGTFGDMTSATFTENAGWRMPVFHMKLQ